MENFWHILVYNLFWHVFVQLFQYLWNQHEILPFCIPFLIFSKLIFWGYLLTVQKVLISVTYLLITFFPHFFCYFFNISEFSMKFCVFDTISDFFKPKCSAVFMEFGLKLCKKYKYDFKKNILTKSKWV